MSTNFQTGIAKEDTGLKAGKTAAENAREKLGGEPDFVLVFSSSEYDYDEVLEGVRQVTEDAELIGASTAGEFTEEDVNTGSVAVGLISSDSKEFFTGLGTGLQESAQKAVQAASEDLPKDLEGYKDYTLINLHDGLAGKGMRSVYASQSFVDYDVSIAGGSAGDDFKMEETDVFVGDKASSDAVGLGLIASDEIINMVVNHGHEPISEPYEVTEVEDNVVKELDGRPAWNVYKEAIRDHAQRIFDIDVDEVEDESEELAKLLTNYEFGLETDDGYKVRWPGPTTTTDGPMSFACKIPEGAKVKVMASPLD
ncbi:MAG: FIST signal transduction protein, partial [Candidatus Nanohalobium sp.]